MENSPMCGQCELMKIAEDLGRMPLVLTAEETSRVLRMPISTVYDQIKKKRIPLANDSPIRVPTLWILRKLGFDENRFENGPLKLASSQ